MRFGIILLLRLQINSRTIVILLAVRHGGLHVRLVDLHSRHAVLIENVSRDGHLHHDWSLQLLLLVWHGRLVAHI